MPRTLGVSDGNASGIAYAQTNYPSYNLYTASEKNATDDGNYTLGISDGNTSGIGYAQTNYASYNLYTASEKNASDDGNYSLGVGDGNTSGIAYVQGNLSAYKLYTEVERMDAESIAKTTGKAEALAEVEAELARGGLSLVTYIEQMEKGNSYTQDWFYQPEMGWLWTNESTYPFFYRSGGDDGSGQWLYFSQLKDQQGPAFYDYQTETWIYPDDLN